MMQIDKTIARDGGSEFLDLSPCDLDPEQIRRFPEEFCRKHQIVLLGRGSENSNGMMPLGMLETGNEQAIHDIEIRHGWKVRRIQLNGDELDLAFEAGFGADVRLTTGQSYARSGARRIELGHAHAVTFVRDQSPAE